MAKTVPCRVCKHIVSSKAEVCPSCGEKRPGKPKLTGANWGCSGLIVVAIGIIVVLSGGDERTGRNERAVSETAPETPPVRADNKPTLHKAVENDDLAAVKALIAGGVDPNSRDKIGLTLLHIAAKKNASPAVIETLIAGGADPNARDKDGHTPLHGADDLSVVDALIEAGADPKARNEKGRTPLHGPIVGIAPPNPSVVEALIRAGADPNARDDTDDTPLHSAARRFNLSVVLELLRAGANPNIRARMGATPLHWAASFPDDNSLAVVEALIKGGADPNTSHLELKFVLLQV